MTQIGINDLKIFIAGTKAVANDINTNFEVLKTAHNDTDARVLAIATTAEAQAGVDDTTIMTPVKVLESININAGGELKTSSKGDISTDLTLELGKVCMANITDNITISLPTTGFNTGVKNVCELDVTLVSGKTVTLPTGDNILWTNNKYGLLPKFRTLTGVHTVLRFETLDEGSTWQASWKTVGIKEIPWTQPTLIQDGTVGVGDYATRASSVYGAPPIHHVYKAMNGLIYPDDGEGTAWICAASQSTAWWELWTAKAIKVENILAKNYADYGYATGEVYQSIDGTNYIKTGEFIGNPTVDGTYNIVIDSANQDYYNYHKLVGLTRWGDYYSFDELWFTAKQLTG